MSFDEIFDYSHSIANINDALANANIQLVSCNSNLSMFQSIIGYNSITSVQIEELTKQQSIIQNQINILQAVLDEILSLTNSANDVKAALYQYYTMLGTDTVQYMRRMLFNFETGLADPDLIEFLGDTTNTTAATNAIGHLIYNRHQIRTEYNQGLNLIILPPIVDPIIVPDPQE